jgi:hypothetical protein
MSTRLERFRLPRGTLGDLRDHVVRQLQDKQRMAALPSEFSWLRDAGEAEVKLWLSVGGDSLASIARFVERRVRTEAGACFVPSLSPGGHATDLRSACHADAEQWLRGETRGLKASSSVLLRTLAAAGEDGSVPPGSEVIKVDADSPEDMEAQEWQRQNILRRDPDAEDALPEDGKKLYTWHHATLRLSAALAFGKKFRPLVRWLFSFLGSFSSLCRTRMCLLCCRPWKRSLFPCRQTSTPCLMMYSEAWALALGSGVDAGGGCARGDVAVVTCLEASGSGWFCLLGRGTARRRRHAVQYPKIINCEIRLRHASFLYPRLFTGPQYESNGHRSN